MLVSQYLVGRQQIGGGRPGGGRHVFNQHVCTMLEKLRSECFHMAAEWLPVKPEAEPGRAEPEVFFCFFFCSARYADLHNIYLTLTALFGVSARMGGRIPL